MVSGITWEEETRARLEQVRKEQRQEQLLADQHLNNANQHGELANALEKVLELVAQRNKVSHNGHDLHDTQLFLQQSTWNNIKSIMAINNGFLVVKDAVTFLLDVRAFNDREQASNTIYSTLYSHKNDVIKVRDGVYRLKESKTKEPDSRQFELIQLKNPMSFKHGVVKVLRDANGEPLNSKEIWTRMQKLGIMSNAKNPVGWVDRIASQRGATKVAPRTWILKDIVRTNTNLIPLQTN